MTEKIVYQFEALGEELPRPPLAALRGLLHAGLVVAPKGWQALPVQTRFELARAGVQGAVDANAVRALAERVPPRYIKLVSRVSDPNPDGVPENVARALGPSRPLTDADWRSMRAVDRAVLVSLAPNARLLALAYEEIAVAMGKPQEGSSEHWFGSVARCEIKLSSASIQELTSTKYLEGRALLLARVAGIRAARRITDLYDLHAEATTGHVELDWLVSPRRDAILWQAHVSSWEGAFFPAASLLAVTTAAGAVFDMIRHIDPNAHIKASVRDEEWQVGSAASWLEEATAVYPSAALIGADPMRDELAAKATIRMAPEDLPRPPVDDLISGSLAGSPGNAPPESFGVATSPDVPPSSGPGSFRAESRRAGSVPASAAKRPAESHAIPRAALWLFAVAVMIFFVSVGLLAYVLVRV